VGNPGNLRNRFILFAVSVIRFCRTLPRTSEASEIANQLRRAGGSIGAHYAAATRPKSDRDYVNKVSGGIEEGDEALYWFDVLVGADIVAADAISALRDETEQLVRILVASRSTARARIQRQRARKER
jgi:four helix bundle protein